MTPLPNLRFPGQRTTEEIKVLVRKHWIMDLRIAILFMFVAGIPTALSTVALSYFWGSGRLEAFWSMVLILSIFLLFILLITYVKWLNEELDVIIVTNERLISHDQAGLFQTQISETSIEQVQDVTGEEHGILPHLLHYGSLEVQTSGNEMFFKIKAVGTPHIVARKIMDLRDAYLTEFVHYNSGNNA